MEQVFRDELDMRNRKIEKLENELEILARLKNKTSVTFDDFLELYENKLYSNVILREFVSKLLGDLYDNNKLWGGERTLNFMLGDISVEVYSTPKAGFGSLHRVVVSNKLSVIPYTEVTNRIEKLSSLCEAIEEGRKAELAYRFPNHKLPTFVLSPLVGAKDKSSKRDGAYWRNELELEIKRNQALGVRSIEREQERLEAWKEFELKYKDVLLSFCSDIAVELETDLERAYFIAVNEELKAKYNDILEGLWSDTEVLVGEPLEREYFEGAMWCSIVDNTRQNSDENTPPTWAEFENLKNF